MPAPSSVPLMPRKTAWLCHRASLPLTRRRGRDRVDLDVTGLVDLGHAVCVDGPVVDDVVEDGGGRRGDAHRVARRPGAAVDAVLGVGDAGTAGVGRREQQRHRGVVPLRVGAGDRRLRRDGTDPHDARLEDLDVAGVVGRPVGDGVGSAGAHRDRFALRPGPGLDGVVDRVFDERHTRSVGIVRRGERERHRRCVPQVVGSGDLGGRGDRVGAHVADLGVLDVAGFVDRAEGDGPVAVARREEERAADPRAAVDRELGVGDAGVSVAGFEGEHDELRPPQLARSVGDRRGGDGVDAGTTRLRRLDVARHVGASIAHDVVTVGRDGDVCAALPWAAVDRIADAGEPGWAGTVEDLAVGADHPGVVATCGGDRAERLVPRRFGGPVGAAVGGSDHGAPVATDGDALGAPGAHIAQVAGGVSVLLDPIQAAVGRTQNGALDADGPALLVADEVDGQHVLGRRRGCRPCRCGIGAAHQMSRRRRRPTGCLPASATAFRSVVVGPSA